MTFIITSEPSGICISVLKFAIDVNCNVASIDYFRLAPVLLIYVRSQYKDKWQEKKDMLFRTPKAAGM